MKAIHQVIISMLIIAAYSIFAFGIFPALATEQTPLDRCGNIMTKDRKFIRCVSRAEMENSKDVKPDYYPQYKTEYKQNNKQDYADSKHDNKQTYSNNNNRGEKWD